MKVKNKCKIENDLVKMTAEREEESFEVLYNTQFFELVAPNRWHIDSNGYPACSNIKQRLHSLLLKKEGALIVDHIDGDKLNNRLSNLRLVNYSVNNRNTKGKGYYYNKKDKKWHVQMMIEGERLFFGSYKTEEEALDARMAAEIEHHGELSYNKRLKTKDKEYE